MIFAPDCLAGRRILVTGASSGIGRAVAIAAAGCGAHVTAMGRDRSRLDETLEALHGSGHVAAPAVDMSQLEEASAAIEGLAREHGAFDGIFHSAGVTLVLPVKLLKTRHLDEVFGASVTGAFAVARAAAKRGVLLDGGALLFMSSVASSTGRMALSSYCAAKAAVDGMVRALAVEFAPRRIRVNSIAAGAIETEMHDSFTGSIDEKALQAYRDFHPLGFGRTEDVSSAALYLLSDAGRWITGTALALDGGATAK